MKYLRTMIFLFVVGCSQVSPTPTASDQIVSASATVFTPAADITDTIKITPTATGASQMTLTVSSERLLEFRGQVSRGEVFEYEISGDLVFRLEPRQHGWDIWIGDKTEPLNDYVAVVTPPYYGMNARYIKGWHFRNSDNSGPNEPGPKLVDAPQKERRFYFILNEADYWIAYNGLNTDLLPSEEEKEQAEIKRDQLEPREGNLTIIDFELGNLRVGEQAWIESMEFEVELNLPSDF